MNYYSLISSMLKSTVSSLLTGLYAVYKGESNALASLTTNLYAVYKGESNANDSLGVYNGTAVGGLTYSAGKSGNAFVGNGTTACVNLPNNAINFTGNFSVVAWVKVPSTSAGLKTIVSNNKLLLSPTRQHGWGCYLNNTEVRFQKYDGTSTPLTLAYDLTTALTINVWHLFVFTYSTTTGRKIYFDGSMVTSDSNVTAIAYDTTHYPTLLAQRYDGVNYEYFNSASLDEVVFYNTKELTSTEVTDLYNSGAGKFYQGNAFYSTIANDSLGVYNGTAVGGLTYSAGKSGNAFIFNGSSYISLPNNMFNTFTGDFSVNMWVYIVNTGANQALLTCFQYTGGNFYGFSIWNYGGTTVQTCYGTPTGYTNLSESSPNPYNTWYMVTVTHKAGVGTKIYYNGALSTSNSDTNVIAYTSPMSTNIGVRNSSGAGLQYYAGNGTKIDEVTPYSKELTSTEITTLYNSGTGKFYPTF